MQTIQQVHHRGLQVGDLRGSVLRCPGHKSSALFETEMAAGRCMYLRSVLSSIASSCGFMSPPSGFMSRSPFFRCCITNKKGNVNHCDVSKAYFGILTANRWKATYQNVLPDHSNTQHQYWAHSGVSGASNPSAALRGHIGPRRHSAFRGWPLAAPDFFDLPLRSSVG